MSSIDATTTLQPEEIFATPSPPLHHISLLPPIHTLVKRETAFWAHHISTIDKTAYSTILAQVPHPAGAEFDELRDRAVRHVLETVLGRFDALRKKSGFGFGSEAQMGELEAMLGRLGIRVVHAGAGVDGGSSSSSSSSFEWFDQGILMNEPFTETVLEAERVLSSLEAERMRRLVVLLEFLGGEDGDSGGFDSKRQVLVVVRMMMEVGIDVEGIFEGSRGWGGE
ncbi:hypothetical protein Q7P37_010967 [Cladosporium fusiforme]